jgi:sugar O-acyltransferase (sialic acid O-acetyltransferase NeuD family)
MNLLIVGTSGLMKDLIGVVRHHENYIRKITLFDNVSEKTSEVIYNQFDVISDFRHLNEYFQKKSRFFIIAIGSPRKRKSIMEQLEILGGTSFSYFCSQSFISEFATISERGVIIQIGCQISSDVVIEDGVFINVGCLVGHDSKIGKFTTLSPRVTVLGNVTIGENCVIATGVTIMPNVIIGNNVKIGMNKLINENVPDNSILL